MSLDAIIIADTGQDGLPRPNPLNPPTLKLDGRPGTAQAVLNYIKNRGHIVPPIANSGVMSWWSAPKYNGIFLLSHLIKHGFEAELVNKYYNQKEHFRSLLKQTPRAVIISTTFILTKHILHELVDNIRSMAPDIFIIAGGPFVYKSYIFLQRSHEESYVIGTAKDDFLFFDVNQPSVDLYIIGRQGEDILCDALTRIKKNRPIDNLPNTARFVGKKYIFTHFSDTVSDAGEVSIDWDSLPGHVFDSGVVPMQASGGCPYKCAFCTFRKDSRFLFKKPLDNLIDELKAISGRGVRYVRFIDDNFRLGIPNLDKFCKRVINEGIRIQWMTMIKVDTFEDADIGLLRQAGCFEVALGLESTDPQVLGNMNKRANPAKYGPVVQRLLEAGINCSCYFLFGFPGETDETALRTREFIKSTEHPELDGILSWNLYSFCLSPLSPIYEHEMREKYGLTGYMDEWKHKTMDSSRAEGHVKEALLELDNSCPIYRGDNLNILLSLTPFQRKTFFINRYRLAKKAMKRQIQKDDIFEAFTNFLSPDKLKGKDSISSDIPGSATG